MKRWYMTIIGAVLLIGMSAAVLIVRPDSFQEFATFVTPTIVALLAVRKAEEAAGNASATKHTIENGVMDKKIKEALNRALDERIERGQGGRHEL